MSGALRNISPVWNTCGEPMSWRVNASNENIDASRSVPLRTGRSPFAITQFCDSQALKSVNLRRW
jgi:hypothetical protein